jgi:membrane protein YdbS with pleckstrin-like domain
MAASGRVERAGRWVYEGLWGILAQWFRVPQEPPTLPCLPGDSLESFRPAEGFLRYLKFQYWLVLAIIAGPLALGWIAMLAASPLAISVLTPLALVVMIVPAAVAYLAIHLRYDSTWYVMTGRSLRIRRGIWIIHETTITFENVQNVEINQGPSTRQTRRCGRPGAPRPDRRDRRCASHPRPDSRSLAPIAVGGLGRRGAPGACRRSGLDRRASDDVTRNSRRSRRACAQRKH